MWSIKLFLVTTLMHVVPEVVAGPVTSSPLVTRAPVDREIGTEYTMEDLEQLFAAKEQSEKQQNANEETGLDAVTSSSSIKRVVEDRSRLWAVQYNIDCPKQGKHELTFKTRFDWDGHTIEYQKDQNIDTISVQKTQRPSNDNFYTADAKITHSACRRHSSQLVCSYVYVATLEAHVSELENGHKLWIGGYLSDDADREKRAVAHETCGPPQKDKTNPCPLFNPRNYKKCYVVPSAWATSS